MSSEDFLPADELLLFNFEDHNCLLAESYIREIWEGEWTNVYKNGIFQDILSYFMNSNKPQIKFTSLNQDELLCVGISSLFCFVQHNFTGPPLPTEYISADNLRAILVIDGEEINSNVEHPELLLVTKYILENISISNQNILNWWFLRYVIIYQHLLDDCSPTLLNEVDSRIATLINWNINGPLKAKLHLEIAQLYLLFNKVNDCNIHLDTAKELLGIDLELSGVLGKRTKFQQKDLAQMLLKIHLRGEENRPVNKITTIPDIIKLDDDVRLDKIEYCSEYKAPILHITEQVAVLATVQCMQRSKPKDELLKEETEAFLTAILQQNNTWIIRYVSLFLRCFMESNHKRTIERSLAQIEMLIGDINKEEPKPLERLINIWSASMFPKWSTTSHMANLLLNLGLVKAALDIFLKLNHWEEVIVCYTIMQLRHKAAEIIQEQITLKPTVKLLCLLGDATDDVTSYEKAWDLSEHKSSRAQRHWGQYLFARKEYAECIPHLQKSLEINSLQTIVWLRLGYAALEVEDWKLAAKAYRRYTYLEPGGFEAWNNLAKAYIKQGEKTRAHYALQEALKFSFDNWKIWENFMVVSAATNNFNDVVRSYHQILDLKEKHLDVEVLFMLMNYILNSRKENEEFLITNARLMTKSRELFGRLTGLYPNDSQLWELYADLAPSEDIKAQRLYRAYRGLAQGDWQKDTEKTNRVIKMCLQLAEATVNAGKTSNTSTARLTIKLVIAAAKKHAWEEHTANVELLEGYLENINKLLV